jgi:transposase-like protein
VHKTANVLNKLPQHLQAKIDLQQIWMAATREQAHAAFTGFVQSYGPKYPKAAECLAKDKIALLAFYDFPAAHWMHLRTTNPIGEERGDAVACITRIGADRQSHHRRSIQKVAA